LSKDLSEDIESIKKQIVPINSAIQKVVERVRPTLETITSAVEIFRQKYSQFIQQLAESFGQAIAEFAKQANEWQEKQKISVSAMAQQGWFPNWFTFFFHPEEKYENLDDFMIAHIDECWDELKKQILKHCPKRKHILEVAFKLHEEGNYIASIPLFLTQSDGICSEEFTYFFTKNPQTGKSAADEIIYKAENSEIPVNFFSEILIEPFKVDLQISKGSSKASKSAKAKGPNRHGIIHGSRKHLDYGSKVNGYKALSFLAFIVFSVKDVLKKHNKTLKPIAASAPAPA
jgi:hypothetical protein